MIQVDDYVRLKPYDLEGLTRGYLTRYPWSWWPELLELPFEDVVEEQTNKLEKKSPWHNWDESQPDYDRWFLYMHLEGYPETGKTTRFLYKIDKSYPWRYVPKKLQSKK